MFSMISAVVIDDDPRYREGLCRILTEEHPEVSVVAEASSAQEAYNVLRKSTPDLLFMDVILENESGFEIIDRLPTLPYYTVYCADDDQYAFEAIKRNAFDYLLKPFHPEDLETCIRRLMAEHDRRSRSAAPEYFRKLEVFENGKMNYVRHSDLVMAEGMGSYTRLHMIDGKRMVVSRNLKSLEQSLRHSSFYRVHNSAIVNLRMVRSCEFGKRKCQLINGMECRISTRKKDGFREAVSKTFGIIR